LAVRFDVSLGYVKKISRQRLHTGQMERVEQRSRGPISKITSEVEAQLRKELRLVADRTLAELQEAVWSEQKVSISQAQLWRALKRMDLRLKKSRSMPVSRTAKKGIAAVRRGGSR
jgi:transposase